MKTVKDFANLVNLEMEDQGLKPQELADMADVSVSCVLGLIRTANRPTIDNLSKILWALGYDIALVERKSFV